MAIIEIKTTEEEHHKVIEAIKSLKEDVMPVSLVAKAANMNPNRVRYVLADLEEAGKIRKEPVKAFNKHYVRYKYTVV